MRKIWSIFRRDVRTASQESIALLIALAPVALAVVITLIAPGVNEASLHVAVLDDTESARVEYYEQVATVTRLGDVEAVEERVGQRDNVVGIVPTGDGDAVEIVLEGTEPESTENYARAINALYDLGADLDDSRATVYDFGEVVPPLKRALGGALLMMITVFAGMIIAFGMVTEKADRTISAVNVTPATAAQFIIGKSLIALTLLLTTSVASLLILGLAGVNWGQLMLLLVATATISVVLGFLLGLSSGDIMEAGSSLKVLMLPLIASVLVYQLVDESWHWTVWWSPFYWAYRGTDEIMQGTATWGGVAVDVAIVLGISALVFVGARPRIRKGLA